ncbi:hypothetical protein ABPG74_002216 [Tetrahymena malaccensis]
MSNQKGEIPQSVLNNYLQMGLNEQLLILAYKNCNGNENSLLDEYHHLLSKNNQVLDEQQNKISNLTDNMDEEVQLNQAILASQQEAKEKNISFEPLNPEQRMRKEGIPVGLKNLGNTCYINPLLQTYFYNAEFCTAIINFQKPSEEEIQKRLKTDSTEIKQSDNQFQKDSTESNILLKRVKASVELVSALQELYILLIGSDKKYIDPSKVIKSIVDEQGNQIQIGDQQDIGEFNLTFLARVDEGLSYSKRTFNKGAMEEELVHSLMRSSSTSISQGETELQRSISISMSDTSVVNSNFFGKASIHMSYPLGDETFEKQEEELFNIIFLDIKHKELYYALDEYVVNHIDEFKNDKGDIVSAQKYNWIKRAPKTLFFQLQRVIFDKEKGCLKKLNDSFNFENEIYLERFTEERSKDYLRIREQVKKLISEKQQYEIALDNINQYSSHLSQNQTKSSTKKEENKDQQSNLGLLSALESTILFLQTNSKKAEVNPLVDPSYFGDNSKENLQIVKALEQYTSKVKQRIHELQEKIKQLENKINESYNGFKKDKYLLQSVIIHDGQADSGHYYSFIKDVSTKKWWRYNDIQVSEETEENVFKEALGGWGKASAYSLIYVKEEVAIPPQAKGRPIRLHLASNTVNQLSASQVRTVDYYTSIIPEDLLNNLCVENLKFQEEIEEYKATNTSRQIIDMYTRRFELNNECARKGDDARKKVKGSPPPFIQFCVYLKLHPKNDKGQFDDLIKWLILDSCVREHYKNTQSLNNLTDKKLEDKLKQQIASLGNFKAPKSIKISSENSDTIEQINSEFIKQLNNAEATIFAMQAALKYDWISSLAAFDYLIDLNFFSDQSKQPQFKDNYFFKISRDTKIIVLIAMLHYYELKIPYCTKENSHELLNGIQAFVGFFKKQNMSDQKTQLTFSLWIDDISQSISDQNLQQQIKNINQEYMSTNNSNRYLQGEELIKNLPTELKERLDKLTSEGDMYYWNANKKEDYLFNELISNFDKIKVNFDSYIKFTCKIRSSNVALFKQDRVFTTNAATFNLK